MPRGMGSHVPVRSWFVLGLLARILSGAAASTWLGILGLPSQRSAVGVSSEVSRCCALGGEQEVVELAHQAGAPPVGLLLNLHQ